MIDIKSRQCINKRHIDGFTTDICCTAVINPAKDRVYIREKTKNRILELDEFARRTIESVDLIKMRFWKRMFSGKKDSTIVNPNTNKVYQTDGRFGLLFEIDG